MEYLNIDYNSTQGWSIALVVILLGVIALSSYQQGSIKEMFQNHARGQQARQAQAQARSGSNSQAYVQARHDRGDRHEGRRHDGNDGRRHDGNDRRRHDDGNRPDRRRHDDYRHDASWRWDRGDWKRYNAPRSSWGWGSWWPSWGWGSWRDPCADVAATQCQYSSNYPVCYNNSYANCVNRGIV